MSKIVGLGVFKIEVEPEGICELCGAKEETRPYGPNGKNVCFDCGMKDEEEMNWQFDKRLGNPDHIIVVNEN